MFNIVSFNACIFRHIQLSPDCTYGQPQVRHPPDVFFRKGFYNAEVRLKSSHAAIKKVKTKIKRPTY